MGSLVDPGDGKNELMLVRLLDSGHVPLIEFACRACAFLAQHRPWRKRTLELARSIPALLAAVSTLDPTSPCGRIMPLRALLNLSTDSANQHVICEKGLELLLEVSFDAFFS